MLFEPLTIDGAYRIRLQLHQDERGAFARTYCREQFRAHGIDDRVEQCNLSRNGRAGTLRGLHLQTEPHAEGKLVRCIRGRLFDAFVDLRPTSPTFLRHATIELSSERDDQVWIPAGCAHGFLTLEDDTEVLYQMSAAYAPQAARGYRWDDPTFGIVWPSEPTVISERDRELPFWEPSSDSPTETASP